MRAQGRRLPYFSEHYHPGVSEKGKTAPGAPPFRSIYTHFCKVYS